MTIAGSHHETTCPISQCPPEIQRVVHADFDDDLSRLTVGQQLVAYVESGNRTETREVVQAGIGENKDQRDDNDRYGFLIPMQDDTDRLFLARAFARTVHHAEQIRLHERLIG